MPSRSRRETCAARPVEDRRGPHAFEPSEAISPPGPIGGEKDLGVAAADEDHAAAAKVVAQGFVVVDFAVEDDPNLSAGRGHRLMARRRQVDDRQPPRAQADVNREMVPRDRLVGAAQAALDDRRAAQAEDDRPAVVRPAVVQALGHLADPRRAAGVQLIQDDSGDAAHARAILLRQAGLCPRMGRLEGLLASPNPSRRAARPEKSPPWQSAKPL